MTVTTLEVGDVLAVDTGSFAGRVIKLGEWLLGEPDREDHVAIAHHADAQGVWWGIEGRPGGVGWVDLRKYLGQPRTVSNAAQPRTDAQRVLIASTLVQMLGTPYDWEGIAADAVTAIHLQALFAQNWEGNGVPGHVVCSSLAAYVHQKVGLAKPHIHPDRLCTPADWVAFDKEGKW